MEVTDGDELAVPMLARWLAVQAASADALQFRASGRAYGSADIIPVKSSL